MKARIYIDGQAGTTGLQIRERLARRDDLELLAIDESRRKDPEARRALIAQAEIAILCLPDEGAREAVELAASTPARLLDASTAHRVADGWIYGLPELAPGQRAAIASAARVSNPGCYPTGVILLLRPLIDLGLLPKSAPIAIHALSGYSGGGRKLIERWEDPSLALGALVHEAPYALDRQHKHIPEMTRYTGLSHPPSFVPAVGPFYAGMRTEIPLHRALLPESANGARIAEALTERYRGERFVRVRRLERDPDERLLDPRRLNGTNLIELAVIDNPLGHVLLVATLDNLGKGAAAAAVQNLNLMLGRDEALGLEAPAA